MWRLWSYWTREYDVAEEKKAKDDILDRVEKSLENMEKFGPSKKTISKINELDPEYIARDPIIQEYLENSGLTTEEMQRYYGNIHKAVNWNWDAGQDNNEEPERIKNTEIAFTKFAIAMEKIRGFFNSFTPRRTPTKIRSPKVKRTVSTTEEEVQKTMTCHTNNEGKTVCQKKEEPKEESETVTVIKVAWWYIKSR